tara:strand:+ start:1736 stop:2089 length:354 start_codon:yes stop_codon:yes gene_type:complete
MNYENKSDLEINKLVAQAKGLIINDDQGASLKAKSSSVLVNCITEQFEFNPCNNPSDAWPIIAENKINLFLEESFCTAAKLGESESEDICVQHKNPLRAAMIVYLMMQGGVRNESTN